MKYHHIFPIKFNILKPATVMVFSKVMLAVALFGIALTNLGCGSGSGSGSDRDSDGDSAAEFAGREGSLLVACGFV